jgi:protein arginine kinase activator
MYDKYCRNCKTTLSSFYATGMLGCPECYKAFETEIELALKKIQGRTFHAGKTPKISKLDRELLTEYERLIEEKEIASLEGRISDMHNISEDIRALAEELKKRGLK